jgi:hypothetical protein
LSRREFIAGVIGAGALAELGPLGSMAFASSPQPMPGLPSVDQLWAWQQQHVAFGTKFTGSAGHQAYIDWLAQQFGQIPGFRLTSDRKTFNRWLATGYSLSVKVPATVGQSGAVPVSYFYPYSGATPPRGVTAKLVDLGTYAPAVVGTSGTGAASAFWEPARGAIALVRSSPSTYPLAVAQTAIGGYEPGKTSNQAAMDYEASIAVVTHPALQGIFTPISLLDARNAGVRGVICAWTGMPDEEIVHQYNPFITPYPSASGLATPGDPGCPALWVGDRVGSKLAKLARSGKARATLTLTADITAGASTETIYGTLSGSGGTGENIIINTHTDGCNAHEENGALGILGLAQHLAAMPRNRNLVFVMVTGHFQLPQFTKTVPNGRPEAGNDAISVWILDHPEIIRRSVLGVTVEHLGCNAWWPNASGAYGPTGKHEWGTAYTMQRSGSTAANAEEAAYLKAVAQTNKEGFANYPVVAVQPGVAPVYLGEGAPLYAAGLGTVSLIPGPSYLLQAGDSAHPELIGLEKLDKNLMYAQVRTFARMIRALDGTATSSL